MFGDKSNPPPPDGRFYQVERRRAPLVRSVDLFLSLDDIIA
jgi:hypothetical protein